MKNILFCSKAHFGDNFFSQPFVKHICDCNPNVTFYYYLILGHSFFENIPNLVNLESEFVDKYNIKLESGNPPEDLINDKDFFFNLIKEENGDLIEFEYKNKQMITFNIWCSFLNDAKDVEVISLNRGFIRKINILNNRYNLNLNYGINNIELLPTILKKPDINSFLEWKSTISENTPLIFAFNYIPRCSEKIDINSILCKLSCEYPEVIFIVPNYYYLFDNISNIKCCDRDFNFIETRSCINLIQIEKILSSCKIIISLISGSNWIFFNRNFVNYETRPNIFFLHNSNNYTKYSGLMNHWYNTATLTNDEIIKNTNVNDIFLEIKSILHP